MAAMATCLPCGATEEPGTVGPHNIEGQSGSNKINRLFW